MAGKCAKCQLDFTLNEITAKCVDCKSVYHPACTRAGSTQNFTKNKNKTWRCDLCGDKLNSSVSVKSVEEDKEDKTSILEALKSMKSDIIACVDAKMEVVNASIASLSEEFRDLKSQLVGLDKRQSEVEECCDSLKRENVRLTGEVEELRSKLLDAEQHARSANLEIVGIPFTQGESVAKILEKTAAAINVPFKEEDISIAHRLRLYSQRHSHPPLIVQFVSRRVREMWLSAVRAKKGLLASELLGSFPATKVFINEHLTPDNKALLGRARRLRREGKIYFAGFTNGKVLVKPREEDAAIRILSLQDLDKYSK